MRITYIAVLLLLLGGCGSGEEERDDDIEARLPHVDAPLDTVRVIQTTEDTSVVEIASGADLAEPAWKSLHAQGLPDPKRLQFTRYENAAYNYSIAYPDTLLNEVQLIGNDRGMEFASSDNEVRMLVFAVEASTREDLDAQYRSALENPEAQIIYRARDENWYIVSGSDGDEVFYEKSLADAGVLKTFRMQYPASQKAYYDAVTAIMSASFSSGHAASPN